MTVNLKQKVWLKLELDGTAEIPVFEGDFRSTIQQAFSWLGNDEVNWQKKGGAKEMLWSFRSTPFVAGTPEIESVLRITSEVMAGIDSSLLGIDPNEINSTA